MAGLTLAPHALYFIGWRFILYCRNTPRAYTSIAIVAEVFADGNTVQNTNL